MLRMTVSDLCALCVEEQRVFGTILRLDELGSFFLMRLGLRVRIEADRPLVASFGVMFPLLRRQESLTCTLRRRVRWKIWA
jgi:hypothetical protein